MFAPLKTQFFSQLFVKNAEKNVLNVNSAESAQRSKLHDGKSFSYFAKSQTYRTNICTIQSTNCFRILMIFRLLKAVSRILWSNYATVSAIVVVLEY